MFLPQIQNFLSDHINSMLLKLLFCYYYVVYLIINRCELPGLHPFFHFFQSLFEFSSYHVYGVITRRAGSTRIGIFTFLCRVGLFYCEVVVDE